MGTTSMPGIMMGYRTHPGGKWTGDYKVICLADFDEAKTTGRTLRCYSVKEVEPPVDGIWRFPLRKILNKETREIKTLKKDVRA